MTDARIVLRNLFGQDQDLDSLSWQPFRPGIDIVRIYGDGESGPAAALLRYAPGARLSPHAHVAYEHIIVLAGSQCDERGEYAQGTCLIHGEGTGHAVASDEGCIVLAIWNAPVQFAHGS
jgi:anti-sigma factor ChrR (cupin superfamily)